MRFLIVDTYYRRFWESLYADKPDLASRSYDEQHAALMATCFGTSDFYSTNLRSLGHEASEVVGNCEPLQRQWARENAPALLLAADPLPDILAAQIDAAAPDVLYVQDMNWLPATFYRALRLRPRIVAGQTAYPLLADFDYGYLDVVFTSFPHYVRMFRRLGIAAEYLRIAFEPKILERLGPPDAHYGAVFVGGLTRAHSAGTGLLEEVARTSRVDFWGYGVETLPQESPIRASYHGPVFGLDMYRVLASSRVALNRHIDVAGSYANNMRLYEATGVGTCLVTDAKENLPDLFEPGKEVVTYRSARECAELTSYYLEHEAERSAIARAGQQRTLREHTYALRMAELAQLLDTYLAKPPRVGRRVYAVRTPIVQRGVGGVLAAADRLPGPLRDATRALRRRIRGRGAG